MGITVANQPVAATGWAAYYGGLGKKGYREELTAERAAARAEASRLADAQLAQNAYQFEENLGQRKTEFDEGMGLNIAQFKEQARQFDERLAADAEAQERGIDANREQQMRAAVAADEAQDARLAAADVEREFRGEEAAAERAARAELAENAAADAQMRQQAQIDAVNTRADEAMLAADQKTEEARARQDKGLALGAVQAELSANEQRYEAQGMTWTPQQQATIQKEMEKAQSLVLDWALDYAEVEPALAQIRQKLRAMVPSQKTKSVAERLQDQSWVDENGTRHFLDANGKSRSVQAPKQDRERAATLTPKEQADYDVRRSETAVKMAKIFADGVAEKLKTRAVDSKGQARAITPLDLELAIGEQSRIQMAAQRFAATQLAQQEKDAAPEAPGAPPNPEMVAALFKLAHEETLRGAQARDVLRRYHLGYEY